MNKTIRKYIGLGMGLVALLAGCSEEIPQGEQAAAASFRMTTRTTETGALKEITPQQFTRLYVAERKPESGNLPTDDPLYKDQYNIILHCDKYYNLDGQTYHLENLLGAWYKFAFVCVPNIGAEMGSKLFPTDEFFEMYKDLYDFKIDYKPVLLHQADLNTVGDADLAIYRKVIDRWIDADMPTHEEVAMSRITGQLVLNMGKPADQFDTAKKGAVKEFVVSFNTPHTCYIRDEACDTVLVANREKRWFSWKINNVEDQKREQRFSIALLPGALTDARVAVTFEDGSSELFTLQGRIGDGLSGDIVIKKNRRTIVLFNGIEKELFEMRYAGFDDGYDATLDVDDDAWDGWYEW